MHTHCVVFQASQYIAVCIQLCLRSRREAEGLVALAKLDGRGSQTLPIGL